MDETVMLGRLTLMLLRASVQPGDSLPPDYGVVILPSHAVLSQEAAVLELARITGQTEVRAEAQGRNLIVSVRAVTSGEGQELEETASNFTQGIRQQNMRRDPHALVRAVGMAEEVLVPAAVVERWLWLIHCSDCPFIGLGLPGPKDSAGVVAVLQVGRRHR